MLFTKLHTLDNSLMKSVVAHAGKAKTSALGARFKEQEANQVIIRHLDKNGHKIQNLRFKEFGAYEGVPMSQVNRELVK